MENNFCALLRLDNMIEKMWELENISTHNLPMRMIFVFSETIYRNSTGRYTVFLPFKSDPTQIRDSFFLAKSRFISLEK